MSGFYAELNKLSTADIYSVNKRKRRLEYGGNYFSVERLLAIKDRDNEEKEYLVLWKDYSRCEATYEPESNITKDCIRYFYNPTPNMNDIHEYSDIFREKLEQSLIRNRRKETLTFEFRGDVFKYLFSGKGTTLGRWQLLTKDNFPMQFFPNEWDSRKNKHGEGMPLHYHVKVRGFISWSPLKFTMENDQLVHCKRAPFEKLSCEVIKVAAE